jgi:beta-fructofuranosidase
MLVGTAIVGGDAGASSFVSDDLDSWSFDGLAATRSTTETDPVWTGALWECPQIFTIDGRDVMVTSVWQDDELHYVAYAIGTFVDGRFDATSWGRLTYGESYYAPSFFRDRDGLPCLISWMRGAYDAEAGRASALSVPHVLRIDGDTLVAAPHPAIAHVSASARTGIAVGEEWTASSADGTLIFRRELDSVVCTWRGEETVVPAGNGEVQVLVDGETAELFTGAALFGVGSSSPFEIGSKSA